MLFDRSKMLWPNFWSDHSNQEWIKEKKVIPQIIPNDALEAFKKHLIQSDRIFETSLVDFSSIETLGQILSAWEDQRTKLYYKAKTELGQLIFLGCLEEAGVDNWEGYSVAWDLAKEREEEKCL